MFNAYSLILGLFLLTGIFTCTWGWRIIMQGRKTLQWPTTQGVIDTSSLSSASDDLLPHITYCYTVKEESYHNTLKFSKDITPTQEFAKSYLDKFPTGQQVQVYYDPSDPLNATLEPGMGRGDWLVFAIGLGMAFFGALLLIFGH